MATIDLQPLLNFLNAITPMQAVLIVTVTALAVTSFALFVVLRVVSVLTAGKKK